MMLHHFNWYMPRCCQEPAAAKYVFPELVTLDLQFWTKCPGPHAAGLKVAHKLCCKSMHDLRPHILACLEHPIKEIPIEIVMTLWL